jgi:hypothetical protein
VFFAMRGHHLEQGGNDKAEDLRGGIGRGRHGRLGNISLWSGASFFGVWRVAV